MKICFLPFFIVAAIGNLYANQGDTITLNLNRPLNPANFNYTPEGYWIETYNDEDYQFIDFEHFSFSHIVGGNSYGGSSWDGFTMSISGDNTSQSDFISLQWGNMAGGGIKTDANGRILKDANGKVSVEQGIPYLIAYWSYYTDLTEDMPSLLTLFDNLYKPAGMYVNASPWPYYGNLGHDNFARALDQDGDYFKLIIHGLDENYADNEGAVVEYYLAKNNGGGIKNLHQSTDWEWVDLSPLGEVYGLYYTMETTDMSNGWPNTSTFFCLDKLQVRELSGTGINTPKTIISVYPNPFTDYIVINTVDNGNVVIYDLSGKAVLSATLKNGNNRINTFTLPKGVYLLKYNNNIVKIVK